MSPFARIRQALSLVQPAPRWMEREDFLRLSRQLREQKGRPVARRSQDRDQDDWVSVPA
ncbi:hypothetical protein [Pseudomonas oryzihabitans]|uniref:hypothetical protein n=1 Tax=Pseudomonas oryzihabitans TaxID=47885 RepID=UPI00214ED929|nr:hypothetical protein [Pseudomonas psychrotolerans]UUW70765.1 hypothetical protein NRG74_16935 [Pseudomonas psychrotolerans]